jgi:phosphoribosylaminoimidazole-succinocarboxamide synthase
MSKSYLVPIILGSHKDLPHANKIATYLNQFGAIPVIRICSAHKAPTVLLDILKAYESNDDIYVYITVAGKSNALSALIDGNTVKSVISCPPLSHASMYDLPSSTSMPTEIAPLVVLNPVNAAVAAMKIMGCVEPKFRAAINQIHMKNKQLLNIEDTRNKYKWITPDAYNSLKNGFETLNEREQLVLKYTKNGACEETPFKKGKIRDIYRLTDDFKVNRDIYHKDEVIALVATNRLSGFDRYLCDVPFKGAVLNAISGWWFEKTAHLMPNHILDSKQQRISIVKQCKVFPIEFVMRSYMTGSTQTSIWQNYNKGVRNYCGHELRDGYIKNNRLDTVLLTPTTKSDIHDELISASEVVSQGHMSQEHWDICEKYAYELFKYGQEVCAEKGLILVDTKYEFGLDNGGNVCLIDEVHTPDSSRFWFAHNYHERHSNNLEPDYIDKEFIRKWVKKTYTDPYQEGLEITISDEMIRELSLRYLMLYELITGQAFS